MSTVAGRSAPPTPRGPDPFRFGWRYVRVRRPDGTEEVDQVPLTLEDVLHPEVGDVIVESDPHDSDRAYLKSISKVRLEYDPTAVVLSDCQVDFNIPGVKPLCPDLAIFLGVRRRTTWSSFNVAREGARPALVIEVTSPETRSNDLEAKVDYYHRARVPWYVIADVTIEEEGERRIELILHRRTARGYRRVPSDDSGRVWLEPLNLWLGQTRDERGGFMRLACYDPQTGEEVGDYAAISRALVETQERLAEESRARIETQERLAEESRARIETQERLAEESRGRAAAEERARRAAEARAAEARALEEAQAMIRALQAQLGKSQEPEL